MSFEEAPVAEERLPKQVAVIKAYNQKINVHPDLEMQIVNQLSEEREHQD